MSAAGTHFSWGHLSVVTLLVGWTAQNCPTLQTKIPRTSQNDPESSRNKFVSGHL
jgi:hypothetical protein